MHLSAAFALLAAATFLSTAHSAEVTVQSGAGQTQLLELYTSEGCSSCPPAEKWFSALRQSPRLWKDVVPIAFHVDYWDNLGWRDPLASKASTTRQRDYASSWGTNSVYTPGFVLNGREWRERDLGSLAAGKTGPGKLAATMRENGEVAVTFQPSAKTSAKWTAHVALLGLGLTFDVKAGENNGRKLVHDFAVLSLQTSPLEGEGQRATLRLPGEKVKHGQTALAVWITEAGKMTPVQAAGGEL